MRKILALLSALCCAAAILVFTAPAGATPTAAETTTSHPYGPYTFLRTHGTGICIIDYLNAPTTHPVGDVGNAFEPSVQTGWRSPSQGCNDYPTYQHLVLGGLPRHPAHSGPGTVEGIRLDVRAGDALGLLADLHGDD